MPNTHKEIVNTTFPTHIKGVSNHSIKHYAKEHGLSIRDIYLKLFQGETLKFDLTCGFQDFQEN